MSFRISRAFRGALAADSLALGVHWNYSQEGLRATFPEGLHELIAPGEHNMMPKVIHAGKPIGSQSHYGDQLLFLLDHQIANDGRVEGWGDFWFSKVKDLPASFYRDGATKDTITNYENGTKEASSSVDLGGVSRLGALLPMASSAEDLAHKCVAQAGATHGDALVSPSARFFAHLVWAVVETGKTPAKLISGVLAALPDLPSEFVAMVNQGHSGGVDGHDDLEFLVSIDPVPGSFGDMTFFKGATCHIPNSVPLTVFLIVKYGNMDAASCVEKAAIANAMLGGDSCTRALLVGLVLGARPGAVVPQRWIETLRTLSIHTVTRVSFQRSNLLALQMLQKSIASASPLSAQSSSVANIVAKGRSVLSKLERVFKRPVLILGSSGEIGSLLTRHMISCGEHLRLGVRSVEGKSSDPGVELVPFDWNDESTYGRALYGISAVIIIFPLQKGMQQVFEKFLPALKAANVPHVVKMSAAGLHLVPPAFNFEAGDDHKTVDSLLKGSGLNCTIVAPSFFATNAIRFQSHTINDHGAFYGSCGDAATAYVAPRDVAECLAACALQPAVHAGKTYTITGPVALKESDTARLISVHLGKEVNYVDVPIDNFVQANIDAGLPQWNVDQAVCLENIKGANITAHVSSDVEQILGRQAMSFSDALRGRSQVCVIIGFGLGAADAVLDGFLSAGFTVAIIARNLSKLQSAATRDGRQNVYPFAADLCKPEQIRDVMIQINKKFWGIDVVVYNATQASFRDYDNVVPVQELVDAAMVNQASLWAAYYAVLPFFKAAGKGAFLTTGGGLSANGAYSVSFGFQLGAPTKSYMKNFAEAMHATHSQTGIRVINMNVSSLLYGGDNVTIPDPNPAKSARYRVKLGKLYVEAATGPIPENVDVLVNDDGCD